MDGYAEREMGTMALFALHVTSMARFGHESFTASRALTTRDCALYLMPDCSEALSMHDTAEAAEVLWLDTLGNGGVLWPGAWGRKPNNMRHGIQNKKDNPKHQGFSALLGHGSRPAHAVWGQCCHATRCTSTLLVNVDQDLEHSQRSLRSLDALMGQYNQWVPGLFRWRPFDFKAIQQCFGGRLADTALVHLRRSKPGQNNGEMMRSGPSPVVRASVSSWLLESDQDDFTTSPPRPDRRNGSQMLKRKHWRRTAAKDRKKGAKHGDGSPLNVHENKAGTDRSCQAPGAGTKALKNRALLHFFEGDGRALPEQMQSLGSCNPTRIRRRFGFNSRLMTFTRLGKQRAVQELVKVQRSLWQALQHVQTGQACL
eukprot:s78_g18.t1